MKNKKILYYVITYFIFLIYLLIAYKCYSVILKSINVNSFFSSGEAKLFIIITAVPTIITSITVSLLKKKNIFELPLMIILNIINICGTAGLTVVFAAALKYFNLYNAFIHQIIFITCIVFIANFVYGVLSTRNLNNSNFMIVLGLICLVLILVINISNVRYRFIRIIVDVLVLIWFSYGVAQDSQKTLKDYEKISNNTEMWLYSLENANLLCDDLIFVFGQLMNLVIDEKK